MEVTKEMKFGTTVA